MADPRAPINPEHMAYLEALNETVNGLAEEVQFLLALNEKNLLILIKQAYLLERIANLAYDAPDNEAINAEQVESVFKEIRALFEEHLALFRGGKNG